MIYNYELKYEQRTKKIGKELVVYESINNSLMTVYSVNFIITRKKDIYGIQLERMYNWLKENHPELLI
jgi:glutathione peroxidase-family protein